MPLTLPGPPGRCPGRAWARIRSPREAWPKLTWFLRDRIRDAHSVGHAHAQQLQDSVEGAVQGILLDYVDQTANAPDPQAIAPARVYAHALWNVLETAADFWHDHPDHPGDCASTVDPRAAWNDPARYATAH